MTSFFTKYNPYLIFGILIVGVMFLDRGNLLEGSTNLGKAARVREGGSYNDQNCDMFCGAGEICTPSCAEWGCANCKDVATDTVDQLKDRISKASGDTAPSRPLVAAPEAVSNRLSLTEQIERLSKLKNEGALTDEEFHLAKQKIIAN
jgi:hypothetical protein|tara:strand:- start:251 stop:694 length:444 start_codon:yes stop_codon:yes gene_type:complete